MIENKTLETVAYSLRMPKPLKEVLEKLAWISDTSINVQIVNLLLTGIFSGLGEADKQAILDSESKFYEKIDPQTGKKTLLKTTFKGEFESLLKYFDIDKYMNYLPKEHRDFVISRLSEIVVKIHSWKPTRA